MGYELKKVCGNFYLSLLFLLLLAANGFLFFFHCTDSSRGFTMLELQVSYLEETIEPVKATEPETGTETEPETGPETEFETEHENDSWGMEGHAFNGITEEDELHYERRMRLSQVQDYASYRQNLINESKVKLMLGIFGDKDSFEGRSLSAAIADYEKLEHVVPEDTFLGSIELWSSWHVSDLILLFLCLIVPLILFTREKETGLLWLTKPTEKGHVQHFLTKTGTSILLMTLLFGILHGSMILICAFLFGMPDLTVAAQSIYGYQGCPLEITAGEFCAVLFLIKYLWTLLCLMLSILVCCLCSSWLQAVSSIAAVAGLALLAGSSHVLWLENVSLYWLAAGEKMLQGAVYLNVQGQPVYRLYVALLFLPVTTLLCFVVSILFYTNTTIQSVRKRAYVSWLRLHPVSLRGWEWHKAGIMLRGFLILAVFLAVQLIFLKNFHVINGEHEIYYRYYSEKLQGEKTAEKDQYIERERQSFVDLHEQVDAYFRLHPGQAATAAILDLQERLNMEEYFEEAAEQYESLETGQSYLYLTPYRICFGPGSYRYTVQNIALMLCTLILLMASVMANESETGVAVLQNTYGMAGRIRHEKRLISVFYAFTASLIAIVPRIAVVFHKYGGLLPGARANSIPYFQGLPSFWTIGGVAATYVVVSFVAGMLASYIILYLSEKFRSTLPVLICSVAILVLPLGIIAMIY